MPNQYARIIDENLQRLFEEFIIVLVSILD